jgi:phosphocarrier protein
MIAKQDGMNSQTVRRTVMVTDPQGLHLRPLTAFAQRAMQYRCEVTVGKDNQRVNGKSPLELMLLAAPQGSELVLEVSGDDAEEAVEVLAELLASTGEETQPEKSRSP